MGSNSFGDCLKTGCQLIVNGQAHWGDLFRVSTSVLVFNAVLNARGDAAVLDPRGPDWPSLIAHNSIWERRGVFVLRSHACEFNQALLTYLDGAPHG